MSLLKKLTIVTVFLSVFSASNVFAAGGNVNPDTTDGQVSNISCVEAVTQLREKVELSQQLGNAYLSTYQTLVDVYSTWGDRLEKMKNQSETAAAAAFFLNSARTNEDALAQSSKVVADLKVETSLLMNRVTGCLIK